MCITVLNKKLLLIKNAFLFTFSQDQKNIKNIE